MGTHEYLVQYYADHAKWHSDEDEPTIAEALEFYDEGLEGDDYDPYTGKYETDYSLDDF